jgi:3',5'-cyclic AMP phosphodiesterase CpdA
MLIAHLSDPHLRAEGELYQGLVDSNAMFDRAIDTLNALDPAPDVVILTGDLVDTGTEADYATARKKLARIRPPLYAIPGNHDARDAFRRTFAGADYLAKDGPLHFDVGADWPVRLLGLDITVPGHHHGDMDADACRWLDERLGEASGKPTLILMHQPPIDSGIACIDVYKCENGTRLAEIVARYSEVERVLCGHVHRFMQARFAGTLLMTAPSTTTAIALRLAPDATPASFVEPPSFLLHHWRPETGLITHWVPIGTFRGPMPFF